MCILTLSPSHFEFWMSQFTFYIAHVLTISSKTSFLNTFFLIIHVSITLGSVFGTLFCL